MNKLSIVIALYAIMIRLNTFSQQYEIKEDKTFKQFVSSFVPFDRGKRKIFIPENIKHIKLDIGLSYSAPMSQYWLSQEDDLLVFGFEPNPFSVSEIRNGAVKRHPSHGEPLNPRYIGRDFFLIPCALGLSEERMVNLYITKRDPGCSSIYEPNFFEVSHVMDIPVFPLSDFFDLFPFDTHPIVEYIKIDAQGADLDIVKSGGNYLKDRVIYITIEAENKQYKNTNNSEEGIENYMISIGFIRSGLDNTQDPTYVNLKFLEYLTQHDVKIYQNG